METFSNLENDEKAGLASPFLGRTFFLKDYIFFSEKIFKKLTFQTFNISIK